MPGRVRIPADRITTSFFLGVALLYLSFSPISVAGMGYLGARTIAELHDRAQFIRISGASLRESHVHDVWITKEPPNYSSEYMRGDPPGE